MPAMRMTDPPGTWMGNTIERIHLTSPYGKTMRYSWP
jgi:hypothetical protein